MLSAGALALLDVRAPALAQTTQPPMDWFDEIKRQHQGIARGFENMLHAGSDHHAWVPAFNALNLILNAHQEAEENIVYPALVREGLAREAEELYHEEAQIKILKARLTLLARGAAGEWRGPTTELQGRVLEHARQHEEQRLLPELHRRLDAAGNDTISVLFAESFTSVKPKRPLPTGGPR